MKRLIVVLLLGCGAEPKVEKGQNDLLIYRDETHRVTCYRIRWQEGIACVADTK